MLSSHFKGPNIAFISVIADKTGQRPDLTAEYPVNHKSVYCYRCFDYLGFLQGQSLQLSRDIYFFCEKCKARTKEGGLNE